MVYAKQVATRCPSRKITALKNETTDKKQILQQLVPCTMYMDLGGTTEQLLSYSHTMLMCYS